MKASLNKRRGLSGTFSLNNVEPFHRWYKYAEGYSSELIINELNEIEKDIGSIYDPFGGSGTTPIVASQNNIKSYYSEINPFMVFVAETKINSVINSKSNKEQIIRDIKDLKKQIDLNHILIENIPTYEGFEKYYEQEVLNKVLALKKHIIYNYQEASKDIMMLSLASILIRVSKMVKRGDLRYAKTNEIKENDKQVFEIYSEKLDVVLEDIINYSSDLHATATFVGEDARFRDFDFKVDCVITSPPYLNGTNYIRNTKLELKLLDFITSEKDIPELHTKGIMAGINAVNKKREIPSPLPEVEGLIESLEKNAYDNRVPKMVSGYFHDMDNVFLNLRQIISKKGYLVLDIGDSQFGGIHVPTDKILCELAENHGFKLYKNEILRERRSKNQMLLSQRLLKFKLEDA